MSDTGLQKVAEGLKAALVPAKWVKDNEYRRGYRQAIAETLDSVLRLIEEEKAQKPTAPASLVEGLCGTCNGSGMVQIAPNVRGMHTCTTCKGKGKMVGYRPAPSCEHIGQYSNNCRYSNNDFKCSLPPKKECVMGFISKCDGTVPPSVRPAPSCEEGLRAEIEILVEKYKDDENLVEGFIWGNEVVSDLESSLSRHPSPEVKGEAREHLEWKGSIDATAKALDKKREDNKGGI